MFTKHRNSNGYTLHELVVVISVAGLTLAGGTPMLRGFMRSQGFEASAGQLVAQLDLARHRAIAQHNPQRVQFNQPAANQYRIHDDDNGNGVVDAGERVYGPFSLPTGVVFQSLAAAPENVLVFGSTGMLHRGQGGNITLARADGRARNLEVFASGLARVLPHA